MIQNMDLDLPTAPQFTVGREIADLVKSSGILHQSWEEIHRVSTNNVDTFLVNEYDGVVYVTFPSLCIEDFMVSDGRYGECSIQNENRVFSACLKGDDAMPALVYKGALHRFLHILQTSDFKARMEKILKQKKEQAIIIVGHSIGGAVATLATLWILEKRARHISPFCITFGSPLVGDARLGEAVGREDWSGKFCHVVSEYDIVPRMLLAPFESISEPLNAIVPHWRSIMGIDSVAVSHLSIQEACSNLLNNVLKCASIIANNYPGDSGLRSPYRPFGTYMFCSTQGAACIEDSEAVLKMLHITMQSKEGMSFDQIAGACISKHTEYGHMLEDIISATKIANFVSDSSFEMGIALELEAMGVGALNHNALLALRKAGEVKNKHGMNIENLDYELSKQQSQITELEWYKRSCNDNGLCYYDAFNEGGVIRSLRANFARVKLGSFWDEIIEMVEKHILPIDIQFQDKWINAGTDYRILVEPLDISYYYRTSQGQSYLSDGVRPHRHIVLEKWMKEKDQTRIGREKMFRTKLASLIQDSCFWARLEEARKALAILQQDTQHQVKNAQLKEGLEKFEDYVSLMIRDRSVSAEIFLQGSSFMTWWRQYNHLQLQTEGKLKS